MDTNKRWPHLAAQRAEENELRNARAAGPLQTSPPYRLSGCGANRLPQMPMDCL
jgi:hypothetical protein